MAVADLIIRLKDQASSGLGRLGGAMGGFTKQTAQAASGAGGLAGAMRDGILQADAIKFGIQKATEAIGFMNSKFEEAKNLQLEQINAASSFAALTGQSSEQAARFIENLNSRLAVSAASLPGATQDYKALAIAVQDNVLEAFKDPSGTLNQKGFEDTLISMSESFGALTAASTRDIGNTSLGLSKALGGASVAELRSIAFFEQNPVILNEIEKQLKAQGKELKDLSIADRVKLLQTIGQKFITDDFKRQAGESVDGLLQSFNSMLFDPGAGIFGIMRDLDPATDGVQSAFSSMNQVLIEVIGSNGVLTQFGDILKAAGVELVDPMAVLKGAIDFAVGGLKRVNQGLTYLKDFIKAGGSLGDAFRLGLALFPRFDAQSIVDQGIGFFTNFGDRVGEMIGKLGGMVAPLFNQGVQIIGGYFTSGDAAKKLYEISVAYGGMLGKMNGAVISFLSQIDYPQLLITIGRVTLGVIGAIGIAVAGLIGGWAIGILPGLGAAIGNIGGSIWRSLDDYLLALGQTAIDAIGLLMMPIRATIGRIPGIGGVVQGILDAQLGALQALLTGGLGGMFTYIINTGKSIITAVQQKMGEVVNEARSLPVIGSVVNALVPPTPGNAIAAGARYSGQIGWAAGGFLGDLFGAAQTEMRRMPTGANLMLANSSETILPAGMLGTLIRTLVPVAAPNVNVAAPAASGGNTFNITVNGGNGDPQAIAQAVIAAIQSQFEAEMDVQIG